MFKTALKLVELLVEHSYEGVYAGGCVRDMVLDIEPNDIDIATNADPVIVEKLFTDAGYKTLAVGKAFGVIVVVVDGVDYEIATFRTDSNYSDGRRPDSVEFSTIEEDCKRRDFTINGMYYDPIKEEIIDLVGGQEDLEKGIIKFIGNPEDRIAEDSLRIIRAVRFVNRFGFELDFDTAKAISNNADKLSTVSMERISSEMEKMFSDEKTVKDSMVQMFTYDLLPKEVNFNFGLFNKINSSMEVSKELCWAALVFDSDDRESVLKSYKLPTKKIKHILGIISDSKKVPDAYYKKNKINHQDLALIKRLYRNDWVRDAIAFAHMQPNPNTIAIAILYVDCFNRAIVDELYPEPLITGDDLLEMNIPKGPIYRDIKYAVETAQLNNEISTKAEAVRIVLDFIDNKE